MNAHQKPRVCHAYFPAFDVFRGIGILFVVLAHTPTPNDVLAPIRPIGALGVHMFFALSGFLITYRFIEEQQQTGRIDLRAFYRRRVRRILPPALIYLALLAVLGPLLHRLPVSLSEISASLFFYRNVSPGGWYTGHFWSLSLEEQFYLAWPVLLVALGISRARIAAIAIIAGTAIWRVHVFSADPSANIYRPDLLADHLLWGCLIALLWKQVLRIAPGLRTAIGIAGICAATVLIYWQPPFWQALFAFSVAVGFILAAEAAQSWTAKLKALQKMGEASYDCYIWQSLFLPLPFAAMALPFAQRLPWSYLLIAAATTSSFLLTFPRRRRSQPVTAPPQP
jgi:peptidoglycan/LPS O-acetylase OafA/YrhL